MEASFRKLLDNINPHRATGPDKISGKPVKEMATEVALVLIQWGKDMFKPLFKNGETKQKCPNTGLNLSLVFDVGS